VNYGRIFIDFFIANSLLSVTAKKFEDRLGFGKVMAKKSGTFFPDTAYMQKILSVNHTQMLTFVIHIVARCPT